MSNKDVEALRSFVDDNEDLDQLEIILDRFNLFESLDLVRQEIRHSAFLRWFLDPSETHGFGDFPLRQFLRRVIKGGGENSGILPSLFELHDWKLGQAQVLKEWRNIDILILDEDNQFVCAMENKVDSGEGECQLKRYKEIVVRAFPHYRRALVFLTISGDAPSDEAYIPVSYRDIASIIENTLKRRESQSNEEIKLFVRQYLDMVRRHLVEDSDVQEICRRLYRNHHRALDLIFEHRLDRTAEVADAIEDYIRSRHDLTFISGSKTYMSFLPQSLDLPSIQENGTPILTWRIANKDEQVRLRLELGPGPEEMRRRVYEMAKSLPGTFGKPKAKLSPKYHTFFSEVWLSRKEYNEQDYEGIRQRMGEHVESLLSRKGEAMARALRELG